jgi:ubiquinone/menaquinone biosynthesis C-methylase UbiE
VDPSPGARRDQYACGYAPSTVAALARRRAAQQAAFFLPHLRRGMRILDCGCGPGAMTVELAEVVAPGLAVGLDIEPGQLAVGRARAGEEPVARVVFVAGDAYDLPFPDETFDAVFMHAVLYHLRRADAALSEVRRVLRRGGVVGVRDADTAGDLFTPATPLLDRARAVAERVLEHGGARPRQGRLGRALLRRAGFARVQASASYESFATPDATRALGGFLADFLSRQHAELVVAQGWATRAEIEEMAGALRAWGDDEDAFAARARCETVGGKE